jgi:hypothetical protein
VLNIDGKMTGKNAVKLDTIHNADRTVPWLGDRSTIAEVGVQSRASPCGISGVQNIAQKGTESSPIPYHSFIFIHLSQMPLQSYHLSINNSVQEL